MIDLSENLPNVVCTTNIDAALAIYLKTRNVAVAAFISENWVVMTPFALYTRLVSSTLRRQEILKQQQQDFGELGSHDSLYPAVDMAAVDFAVPEVEIFDSMVDAGRIGSALASGKVSALKLDHDLCMFISLKLFMVLTQHMHSQLVHSQNSQPEELSEIQGWNQSARLLSSLLGAARAAHL